MNDVSKALRASISSECLPGEDASELTASTPRITGGILDSISMPRLVTFLEDHSVIAIEAHEAGADRLGSSEQIVAMLAEKRRVA